MKKALVALLLLFGLTFTMTSCSKEEVNTFSIPAGSILVSMPGETGFTYFDTFNISSIEVTSTPNGWTVDNIDLYNGTITVTAPSSFDNEEAYDGTLSMKGYSPTGKSNTQSIYVAILPNADIDYSDAPANCYIANQADTRYKFNPFIGGNATPLATERVAVIWQTSEELIKYLDMRDGKARFYIGAEEDDEETSSFTSGNALIGAYDADDNLIWSWHIWVTNGDPTSDVITLNDKTLMNINLGANCNSAGSTDEQKIHEAYGMYYQWGRKEPFVGPASWNFKGNADQTMYTTEIEEYLFIKYEASTTETGNSEWTTANPTSFVLGNKDNGYDWYATHDNALWSSTSKSEADPCPAGWRVADSSLFENLTIAAADDAMPWEEAQPMRGWWLEDTTTGAKHFFSAAGRRNYLDGHLDNMNDDPTYPVPWSGYYWTTDTDGADAKALYFDLNTATRTWNSILPARAMHRANALPVRCVKE